jgi:hypothetical protein
MSLEDATELARRIHAVMQFHAIPDELYGDMRRAVNDLFNSAKGQDLIEDKPAHLRDTLLGYTGNTNAIKQAEQSSTLPDLLSQVMNHPDMPGEMRSVIWEFFQSEIGNKFGDWDSPEWFAAVTGIKAHGFNQPAKRKGKK